MNLMSWTALYVRAICVKFIKPRLQSLKAQASTLQTIKGQSWKYVLFATFGKLSKIKMYANHAWIWLLKSKSITQTSKANSYPQVSVVVDKSDRHAVTERKVIHMLYRHGTLRRLEPQKAHPKPFKRLAWGVAAAIGISLFLPMQQVSQAQIMPTKQVLKSYTRSLLSANQYKCVSTLWGKESAWDYQADNPHSTAYGIPQILGMTTTNPYTQITMGLRYIEHRYDRPCKALAFHNKHGWY